ncbi:ABC transporter ATP-binding protein [Pontibaca methylaminivorans]|uniref:Cu-processing system ATP-binding protein n=1 Tax=Pontibaca methylaminivorans TaxID=515897 RepID=A0A1R3WR02_9RHOB|nr:ABC transporter ATP-binding protein [Pontibaca methylaminivorans]SIT79033.1 Cu-processing system ATP-binding protein [Pontibaca methylaminivorans]
MCDILTIEHIDKWRGKAQVLRGVNLNVAAGERVALLGHNGAGKTTLMKAILGLTRTGGGRISIDGAAPGSAQARRKIAYLPESVAFHKSLTGREQLVLFARLAGVGRNDCAALLERVGLAGAADRRIGTYSKGMRQRLGLAQVLLGRPKLALLDEPTSGLDPISRHDLYAIIDELAGQGTAVLIASHSLTEVEARTDRIAIMRRGEVVADDTLARLTETARLPIRIRVEAARESADLIATKLDGTRMNGARVDLVCPPSQKMEQLRRIAALGDGVLDVDVIAPRLEELYRHYSEGEAQ